MSDLHSSTVSPARHILTSKTFWDNNTIIPSQRQKCLLLNVRSNPCHQLCGFPAVSTFTLSLPSKHNTEWSTWGGEAARGGKSPHWQLPSTVDVDVGRSPGDLGRDAQSELGLIVLFFCSFYAFLPAPLRKKPQAPWPLDPQRWGPMGVGGGKSGGEDALQHVVTSFGASQTVFP